MGPLGAFATAVAAGAVVGDAGVLGAEQAAITATPPESPMNRNNCRRVITE